MKNNYPLFSVALMSLFVAPAFATIQLSEDLLFSAFGSTSVTKSDHETPIFLNREITDETCFDCDTTLGLQLDYQFLTNFAASIQVVKRPQDEWSEPDIEWAYIGYNYDQYDIKIGRLRTPTFLDSEYYYVAHAYASARPPQEVYDSQLGITSYDGISLKWQGELTDEHTLSIEPYGTFLGERDASKGTQQYEFDIDLMIGMKIELSSYDYRLFINGLRTDFDMEVQIPGYTFDLNDQSFKTYSMGGEYLWDAVTLRAETYYSKDRNFNWYAQIAYDIGKFTPYVSYAEKNSIGDADENDNQSITIGVHYDITPSVSINLDYQREMTDDYTPAASGQFTETFAAGSKTDANIYTLMVNFIL